MTLQVVDLYRFYDFCITGWLEPTAMQQPPNLKSIIAKKQIRTSVQILVFYSFNRSHHEEGYY